MGEGREGNYGRMSGRGQSYPYHMSEHTKEIAKIKLTLTTNCNSSCPYCFVHKTHERMPFETAKKSVDLLLGSPGDEKLLSLYGGEPFTEFPLIERITEYARERERETGKHLIISICSNLLILDDAKIAFLKKYRVKVTVSLVGGKAEHDRYRPAAGKGSPYDRVVGNMRRLAASLPKEDIGISFVVFPDLVARMPEYFSHILSLGLSDNINFELVQEFGKWMAADRNHFVTGFHKILLSVVAGIGKGSFVFVNPISWELGRKKLTDEYGTPCPVRYNLEVYPSGDMAFSPFLLNYDENERGRFLVGTVATGLNAKFGDCAYDAESERCRNCDSGYWDGYVRTDDAYPVVASYGRMSLAVAKEIERRAERNPEFRRYVEYAKHNLCF